MPVYQFSGYGFLRDRLARQGYSINSVGQAVAMQADGSLHIDPDAQVGTPLRDLAFQTVLQAIQRGYFSSGEHLSEQRLSRELGISRTPIREALRKLEADGWVERKRSGLIVAGLGADDIGELFGVRIALETHAAGVAATRTTPSDIAELRRINQRFRVVCREHRAADIVRLNIAFHVQLTSLARNRLLSQIVEGLSERMRMLTTRVIDDPVLVDRTPDEHDAIIDAIADGDGRRAADGVREHLCRVQHLYTRHLDRLSAASGSSHQF